MESQNKESSDLFDIINTQYSDNLSYDTFYYQFRTAISKSLKKQGTKIDYLNDNELLEDETISPTFEDIILIWCMEKIDPSLPKQVIEAFSQRLTENVSLKGLQKEIFEYLLTGNNLKITKEDDYKQTDFDFESTEIKEEFELQADEIEEPSDQDDLPNESFSPSPSPTQPDSTDEGEGEEHEKGKKETNFYCTICNKNFPTSLKFYYHKRIHKPKKFEPSSCKICNKTYDTKQQLIHHRSKFHKTEQQCDLCKAVFMNKIKFFQHMKEHKKRGEIVDNKTYTCEICNKAFNDKKKLIHHRSNNHRIYQKCTICYDVFSNKVKFYTHMKDHEAAGEMEDAEALLCLVCWRTHTSKEQLEEHMKTHNEERDIKVDVKEPTKIEDNNVENTNDDIENKQTENSFECDVCNKHFPSSLKLFYHKRNHKPKKLETSVCEFCNKCFPTKKQLIAHRSKFHKVEQQCEVCKETFLNKIKFWRHMKAHKEKGELKPDFEVYLCEICNKTYDAKKKLNQHISNSHRIDQTCEICLAVFCNKIKFYQHVQGHEESSDLDIEALLCLVCWRTHTSKTQLDDHMIRSHPDSAKTKAIVNASKLRLNKEGKISEELTEVILENSDNKDNIIKSESSANSSNVQITSINGDLQTVETSYMCDICGKETSSLAAMSKHNKWHQDQENPSCLKCDIDFEDRISYRSHMRTHRGENPKQKNFTCEKCGQNFVSKFSLWKHNKIHDGGKLRCETCGRSFYDEKDMGQHVCKHFACQICDMKFLRAKNHKLHARMHAGELIYQCDLCEALFDTKRKMNEHRRAIHIRGKKYKCDVCPKSFIGKTLLEKHKRSHTGERPFKCTECGAGFTQKGNLNTHFLLHTKENPFECVGCQEGFRTSGELKRHRETKMCGFEQSDLFKNKS